MGLKLRFYFCVEFKNLNSFMYVTKGGDTVQNWVNKYRLHETDTGIAPDYFKTHS